MLVPCLPGHKVKKLDARAREAMLIGYSLASKAYKLWDVELKKVVISMRTVLCSMNALVYFMEAVGGGWLM